MKRIRWKENVERTHTHKYIWKCIYVDDDSDVDGNGDKDYDGKRRKTKMKTKTKQKAHCDVKKTHTHTTEDWKTEMKLNFLISFVLSKINP